MNQPRIYVVEDEAIVNLDICSCLEQFGYCVAGHAASGEEALRQIDQAHPDLVLMDIHLKGELNGIQAAEHIRARHQIPVIFLTAFADQETVQRASLAEPFGYVVKPFEERELNSAIVIALYKHKTEQNLRSLQQRYRAIAEDMPALVCRFWPGGELSFVNQQYCRYYNRSEEALLGSSFLQFIPEQERNWVSQHYHSLTPDKPVVTYEHQMLGPDGATRWQRWTYRGIYDERGRLLEYQAVGEDITERRYAEDALRQSEAKFRNVFHQSQEGIALTDEMGMVIDWNAAMQRLTGVAAVEVLERPIWDVQYDLEPGVARPEEYKENLRDIVQSALLTGEASWLGQVLEREFHLPDGSSRYIQGVLFPVRTHKGYMLCSMQRDITNQRQLESQIRLQSAALNAAANAIVITDTAGTIVWVNDAFTALTGYCRDDVMQQNPRLLKSGFHNREFYERLWSTILSGETWRGEVINRRKDGQVYYEEMTVTPVFSAENTDGRRGAITHFVAVKQDISSRKQAELVLARRLEFEQLTAEISAVFVQNADLAQSIHYTLERIGYIKGANRTGILLLDPAGQNFSLAYEWFRPDLQPIIQDFQELPREDLYWLIEQMDAGGFAAIEDMRRLPVEAGFEPELLTNTGLLACIFIPLAVDTALAGMIVIGSSAPRAWDQDNISLLQTISGLIGSAMQRTHAQEAERQARLEVARLYQEAVQLSITDPLTGLYNRRYFYEVARTELTRLKRFHQPFCVIILDIDYFKQVNDHFGHLIGDQVLNAVAQHLRYVLRGMDTVARFGGEEFSILLPQTSREEGLNVAE
ncbi:MAG: PAS domain S-box protein [Chloroflexota bacterium]